MVGGGRGVGGGGLKLIFSNSLNIKGKNVETAPNVSSQYFLQIRTGIRDLWANTCNSAKSVCSSEDY